MPPRSLIDLPDNCKGEIRLPIPKPFRRGRLRDHERMSIESAVRNLKGIATRTGRANWSTQRVLDFGCGVKISQALIQYDVDVRAYVGMDVHEGMIDCLKAAVNRPNFSYHRVPFQNANYNPLGVPMTEHSELPGGTDPYDLIVLQSVFTHFAPADFQAALHVLRRYTTADTLMLFTCFIDDEMATDFLDAVPDRPLLQAYYKETAIRKMLERSRWQTVSFHPKSKEYAMNPHFVCAPG